MYFTTACTDSLLQPTLDGAQIVDDTWPIPYFADTYAQSFLDTYGTTIDANPVTCRTDSDCPPSPGDSKTPGSSVFCEPSGYCTVPWKRFYPKKAHEISTTIFKFANTNSRRFSDLSYPI